MGLDLTLVPCRFSRDGKMSDWTLAHTRIGLDRNYEIFGQISVRGRGDGPVVCQPKPIPDDVRFDWYEDDGLKERKDDPYGDKLTYVTAGELAKVDLLDAGPWNRAAFAFIKELSPETPVVLWWH